MFRAAGFLSLCLLATPSNAALPGPVRAMIAAAIETGDARKVDTVVELAKATNPSETDEVDALYTSLFRELLTYMMEDPRLITQCTHLLFCGKSLERAGDHATNIAEAAYYLETGRQLSADTAEDLHRQQVKE